MNTEVEVRSRRWKSIDPGVIQLDWQEVFALLPDHAIKGGSSFYPCKARSL